MKQLTSRISPKLVLYIVIFSSCITLLLTLIQLRLDYNVGIKNLHQRMQQIQLTRLSVIQQSLWTLDEESIQTQLESLLRIPDIVAIELTDTNNDTLHSLGQQPNDHTLKQTFPVTKVFRGKEILLGELNITATKNNLYQQLIDTALVILISQAVKTFFVSAFIFALFYFLVTRHIANIAEHQNTIDLNHRPHPLKLNRRSYRKVPDELDLLVNGFNQITNNYYQNYNTLLLQRDQLTESEARIKAIFNSIGDSIIVTDIERNIILINEEFHNQFGYNIDEIIGKKTRSLYANPEDYEEQGQIRYQPGADIDHHTYEINYIKKDGTIFPGETLGGQIRLSDGTLAGFIGIIRDITYRKKSEEDYKILLRELQQAQKMESIGHLTGGIAHDFNNILASIMGYTDLAMNITSADSSGKLHQYLTNVRVSSERASNLVNQMLAFSRNTASEPEPVQASNVINETIEILAPTLPSSIRLDTYLEDELPSIMMDKTQFQQILINICVNAKDAMNSEGVLSLSLKLKKQLSLNCNSCHALIQGDYIDIAISDTGTGMDGKLINHIFDPFFTTKEVGKGTGMGLSVVHGILHQHNAHISVTTHKDFGTTFHLLFPPTDEPGLDENTEATGQHLDNKLGKGKHILIVDDEELILHYLKSLLEMHGYTISLSSNSMQALELLKQNSQQYDLLITDQTMPNLTGLNLVKALRHMGLDMPVILCSGYSEKVNRDNALTMGINAFINKPISQNELLGHLKQLTQADVNQTDK